MFYLQDQATSGSINQILERIDQHLKEEKTKFLLSDSMTRADCYLLPTLQHVRVAGKVSDQGAGLNWHSGEEGVGVAGWWSMKIRARNLCIVCVKKFG